MTKHSYRKINYQCEECDFLGMNIITMEVHIRKVHSNNITCGMCDYAASDLSDIKNHIKQEHSNKYTLLDHYKQDRNNSDQIVSKNHSNEDLFKDQN